MSLGEELLADSYYERENAMREPEAMSTDHLDNYVRWCLRYGIPCEEYQDELFRRLFS